jgi:flavin reductase (DIM6/NTAB) family NADH-FMN oxidoreductase RutF
MQPVAPTRFRAVMGHFATGVTVVTVTGPEGARGLTANAVCSLSLDPVLVLVCFDNGARTLPAIRAAGRFGVNVLHADQEGLARRFASKVPEEDKFDGVAHAFHAGIPILADAVAWVGCELRELLPGGDHTIGIGSVLAAETGARVEEPLLFYRGRYGSLAR